VFEQALANILDTLLLAKIPLDGELLNDFLSVASLVRWRPKHD
jgi:hypothetical protein